jgi:3-isopropylmalate/(R)-2-methylmalate dehydratase small subunit
MNFELNQPRFAGRSILVARNNFGCGSSREHAVWALAQDGYRVVIAPWKAIDGKQLPAFADIFRINASKNGVLTIELSEGEVDEIFNMVGAQQGLQAEADLEKQQIIFHGSTPKTYRFDIDPAIKEQMLKGLDDIDLTLQYESDITRFEADHDSLMPTPAA